MLMFIILNTLALRLKYVLLRICYVKNPSGIRFDTINTLVLPDIIVEYIKLVFTYWNPWISNSWKFIEFTLE